MAILVKMLRSKVMARKASQGAIMQIKLYNYYAGLPRLRSVYLESTRSHNEGHVSTPACYLRINCNIRTISATAYGPVDPYLLL